MCNIYYLQVKLMLMELTMDLIPLISPANINKSLNLNLGYFLFLLNVWRVINARQMTGHSNLTAALIVTYVLFKKNKLWNKWITNRLDSLHMFSFYFFFCVFSVINLKRLTILLYHIAHALNSIQFIISFYSI